MIEYVFKQWPVAPDVPRLFVVILRGDYPAIVTVTVDGSRTYVDIDDPTTDFIGFKRVEQVEEMQQLLEKAKLYLADPDSIKRCREL